jgi:hypothetical protein
MQARSGDVRAETFRHVLCPDRDAQQHVDRRASARTRRNGERTTPALRGSCRLRGRRASRRGRTRTLFGRIHDPEAARTTAIDATNGLPRFGLAGASSGRRVASFAVVAAPAIEVETEALSSALFVSVTCAEATDALIVSAPAATAVKDTVNESATPTVTAPGG